jgi:hypothetical protein
LNRWASVRFWLTVQVKQTRFSRDEITDVLAPAAAGSLKLSPVVKVWDLREMIADNIDCCSQLQVFVPHFRADATCNFFFS